jgi:outer membrane protein OmpA-like peptidoglycan-associated protein
MTVVEPETLLPSQVEPPPPAPVVLPEPPSDAISLATLPWSVHFPTNGATISSATAKILERMGEVLLRHPIARIRLEGHADQRGDAAYNKALSKRRTQAVKAFLVGTGIPDDHISTTALGMSQPLSRSRKNHEMAKNRRVVIIVTNIEEIRSEEQYVDLQPDLRKKRKSTGQAKRGTTVRPPKIEKKKRAGAQP